jgi:site-specific DNA-cytosine methylase
MPRRYQCIRTIGAWYPNPRTSRPLEHWCRGQRAVEAFGRWTGPTVAYGNREVHVHPSGRRRLSVYEALLLQGFPPEYELVGSLSAQISQVSEAVPPPFA